MKKKLILSMLMAGVISMMTACGNTAGTQEDVQNTETVEAVDAEEETEDDAEEESGESTEDMVKVTFDYNYDGAPEAAVIEVVAGSAIQLFDGESENTAPETPVRDGYRFAGWDTSAEPVLENGYSTTMWPIGDYYLVWYTELGPAMGVEEERMELKEDTTLYARWVEKTVITTPEELLAMREDLSGWYVLGNDIDLTGVEWTPVGTYVSCYEYLNPTWWKEAFMGELDGDGHTITGLTLNTVNYFEDDESSRKSVRNGVSAMFSAVGYGGSIKNLTLDKVTVDVESDIHYAYVAPLAGMVEDADFEDCHVTNLDYKAVISDTNNVSFSTATTGIYTSLSGLICGVWSGTVDNCTVQGTMDITMTSNTAHEGNAFVGGLLGDGYIALTNCFSDVVINCNYTNHVEDPFEVNEEENNYFNLYCGGNAGLAAALISCPGEGNITVKDQTQAGNVVLMCEGVYGSLLGDPAEALVASDYNGTVAK